MRKNKFYSETKNVMQNFAIYFSFEEKCIYSFRCKAKITKVKEKQKRNGNLDANLAKRNEFFFCLTARTGSNTDPISLYLNSKQNLICETGAP